MKEIKYSYPNALIIDDDELDSFINEKTLENAGFARNIYVHTSAQSALEFLYDLIKMGDLQKKICPQIIFVDINMPLMDGFGFIEECMRIFHKLAVQPRIVILTSSLNFEDRQKAARISTDIIFLNKPLTREQLRVIG